jgi:small-conductance mechanosensitive channel
VTLLALGLPSLALAAGEGLDGLAERLIELRGRVESIQDDIEAKQDTHRSRMSTLANRRASLESEIQAKRLQLEQMRRATNEKRSEIQATNAADEALTPTAKAASKSLRSVIARGLPFQREERLKSVDEISSELESGELTSAQALERLWSLIEDELRVSRENAAFRQEVTLDGRSYLAEVIHLGTAMLFFQTEDGQSGFATQSGSGWKYRRVTGSHATQIDKLFESFERQVRSGVFTLPNPYAGDQR